MNQHSSLMLNAFYNVIYKVLNIFFPLITSVYASRILLPAGVGKIAYAQNIVSYFVLFASMGIPAYGTREIAKVKNKKVLQDNIFCELFLLNCLSTTLSLSLYVFFVCNNSSLKNNLLLYVASGLQLIFNFINIDWFYQGLEAYKYITIRNLIIKFIALICIFCFVKSSQDFLIYTVILNVANGGNNVLNFIHVHKNIHFSIKTLKFKHHIKPIVFLLLCTVSTELYSKIDITMLGMTYDDNIIGYYSNAQKTVNIITTLTVAITVVFMPRLSTYYEYNREKFHSLVNYGFEIILFIALPSTVGLFLIAPELVYILYGLNFSPAILTIQILSPLILIKSIGNLLCYQVIISSSNEKYLVIPYISTACLNIILNFLLIPSLKHNGAALASLASELFLNMTISFFSMRITKIKMRMRNLFSELLAVFCIYHLNFLSNLITSSLLLLITKIVGGILVYFFITFVLKNNICKTLLNIINLIKNKSTRI